MENKKTQIRKYKEELAESHDKIFKQFWIQKLEEVLWFILIVTCIVLLPVSVGSLVLGDTASFCHDEWGLNIGGEVSWNSLPAAECSFGNYWPIGFLALSVILVLGYLFYMSIKTNWDKAKGKVEKEIAEKYDLTWWDL